MKRKTKNETQKTIFKLLILSIVVTSLLKIYFHRCNSENDCHSFWRMDGSKCRDVKVGPFSHIESENALNKGKKKQ